jgi:predicted phosphodiesterase
MRTPANNVRQTLIVLFLLWVIITMSAFSAFGNGIKNPEGDISSLVRQEGSGDRFTFAALGDSRSGIEICESILSRIGKEKVAFAIFEGDFVPRNTEADYKFFVRMVEEATEKRYPVFMVAGNHDIKEPSGNESFERYERYFGRLYYWFSFKNALFIVLNNADGNIDQRQLQWFKDVLEAQRPKFKHCFLFMHIPLYDYREGLEHAMNDKQAPEIIRLVETYKVSPVFASHIHAYHKEERNGITYIITGGAGARLASGDPAGAFYHFVLVHVRGDLVETEVVPIPPKQSLEDRMEYFWAVRVWHYMAYIAISVVIVIVCVYFAFRWLRGGARRKAASGS